MSPLPTPLNRQDADRFQLQVGTDIASVDQTCKLIGMGSLESA